MEIIRGSRAAGAAAEQRTSTFTGTVWADPVQPTTEDGVTINHVLFTPQARTYWHRHERGQILHVTAGSGLVCSEGEQPQRLGAGDTVWVPAGELHWHGAGPDGFLSHLAVSLGTTEWHEEVSQDEYKSAGS